jgi:hypothetical protein
VQRPRAVVTARRCARGRCTVTVSVLDPSPSAGIAGVRGRLTSMVGRRTRTRALRVRRLARTLFRLRTPRLGRGRHILRVTATDRAGNAQVVPTTVRLAGGLRRLR